MANTKKSVAKKSRKHLDPDAREKQIIALAMDEAERRIKSQTASSQLLTHFVKLGSSTNKLDNEIKTLQKELVKAKTKSIENQEDMKNIMEDAIKAMARYQGNGGR